MLSVGYAMLSISYNMLKQGLNMSHVDLSCVEIHKDRTLYQAIISTRGSKITMCTGVKC